MDRGCESPPADAFRSPIPSPPCSPYRCTEYLSRILDLEGRLSFMKRRAKNCYGPGRQILWLDEANIHSGR
jgi:hypothetical protein